MISLLFYPGRDRHRNVPTPPEIGRRVESLSGEILKGVMSVLSRIKGLMSVPERAAAPRELQPTPGNPSRRRNTDKATSAGRVAVGPDDMLESFLHRLRSSCLVILQI
eukprot:503939-Prorocentrum_minimum.AAC.1